MKNNALGSRPVYQTAPLISLLKKKLAASQSMTCSGGNKANNRHRKDGKMQNWMQLDLLHLSSRGKHILKTLKKTTDGINANAVFKRELPIF